MLILTNASTDKLQVITSAAALIDVLACHVDQADSGTNPAVDPAKLTPTAITTATTTDIVATPGAGKNRNVKTLHIRNKDTAVACDITVQVNRGGTLFQADKTTLNTGDSLEYIEGVGFFNRTSTAKLDAKLYVSGDVVNATTSFADVTGLTVGVKNGKKYAFETHLIHQTNASTTGAQFGVNGPTMTNLIVGTISTVTASVTAGVVSAGAVTALNTAATAQTTGSGAVNVLTIMSGGFEPSADGTFAIRCASEVAVASGLTVKRGSWLRIWETDN